MQLFMIFAIVVIASLVVMACNDIGIFEKRLVNLATIFAPAVTAAAIYAAYNSGQEQLARQQRPWLKVSVAADGPLEAIENGPASLPLKITLENVGNVPALNVRSGLWATNDALRADAHADWARHCDDLTQPLDNPTRGFIIFPSEKLTLHDVGLGNVSVVALMPQFLASASDFGMSFHGCFDYISPTDNSHHQAGFFYRVARLVQRSPLPPAYTFALPRSGTIDAISLILLRSPSSSAMTN